EHRVVRRDLRDRGAQPTLDVDAGAFCGGTGASRPPTQADRASELGLQELELLARAFGRAEIVAGFGVGALLVERADPLAVLLARLGVEQLARVTGVDAVEGFA